jgi:hypothetical protein
MLLKRCEAEQQGEGHADVGDYSAEQPPGVNTVTVLQAFAIAEKYQIEQNLYA